jgi:hypothetical protein
MRFWKCGSIVCLILLQTIRVKAEILYGITNQNELVTIDSTTRAVISTLTFPDFSANNAVQSIDFRPATGELFALTRTSDFNSNLYKINPLTGASTLVTANIPQLSGNAAGNARAIDFNPTVDRIRVVTDAGINLRLIPDTGAVVLTSGNTDGNLAFAAGDANAGDSPLVVNGAYTNSFAGATTTTLYNLEAGNDILTTQNPPNNGTLNTVGPLGFNLVNSGGFNGFDISGATGTAYLVGNAFGFPNPVTGALTRSDLYTINLATGQASSLGAITGLGPSSTITDLAVAPTAVPEPSTIAFASIGIAFLAWRRWRAS